MATVPIVHETELDAQAAVIVDYLRGLADEIERRGLTALGPVAYAEDQDINPRLSSYDCLVWRKSGWRHLSVNVRLGA